MIIIDAVRRSLNDTPLAIRCQPYEHKFVTVEPEYMETMTGSLGTSAIPGRWSISFKVQMAASDTNAAKLAALANKAPEETIIYWMQFPVVDYAWWRRRAVPDTEMVIREGLLCEYYPAILGVVTVKQTNTDGCHKEFEVQIEETRRIPEVVAPVDVQTIGLVSESLLGVQNIYVQMSEPLPSGNPVQLLATVSDYNQFLNTYSGFGVDRVWATATNGSIVLDSGWMNGTVVPLPLPDPTAPYRRGNPRVYFPGIKEVLEYQFPTTPDGSTFTSTVNGQTDTLPFTFENVFNRFLSWDYTNVTPWTIFHAPTSQNFTITPDQYPALDPVFMDSRLYTSGPLTEAYWLEAGTFIILALRASDFTEANFYADSLVNWDYFYTYDVGTTTVDMQANSGRNIVTFTTMADLLEYRFPLTINGNTFTHPTLSAPVTRQFEFLDVYQALMETPAGVTGSWNLTFNGNNFTIPFTSIVNVDDQYTGPRFYACPGLVESRWYDSGNVLVGSRTTDFSSANWFLDLSSVPVGGRLDLIGSSVTIRIVNA